MPLLVPWACSLVVLSLLLVPVSLLLVRLKLLLQPLLLLLVVPQLLSHLLPMLLLLAAVRMIFHSKDDSSIIFAYIKPSYRIYKLVIAYVFYAYCSSHPCLC